jgi:S-methylmethionine-dependent homocysteine/selenocysteine methylase
LFNCSEPEAITNTLKAIADDAALSNRLQASGVMLGAYANRLTPVPTDWTLADSAAPQAARTDLDPEHYYTDFVAAWVNELNVKVVGGCCAMTPKHIAYLKQHLETLPHKK